MLVPDSCSEGRKTSGRSVLVDLTSHCRFVDVEERNRSFVDMLDHIVQLAHHSLGVKNSRCSELEACKLMLLLVDMSSVAGSQVLCAKRGIRVKTPRSCKT